MNIIIYKMATYSNYNPCMCAPCQNKKMICTVITCILLGTYYLSKPASKTLNNIQNTHCEEKRFVYFLKAHKTGSTTLRNILQRFTLHRNLTEPVLMRKHSYPSRNLIKYLRSIPTYYEIFKNIKNDQRLNESMKNYMNNLPENVRLENNRCNVLDTHTVFDADQALKIFPQTPVFITTIRHPLAQMKSAFKEWKLAEHLSIPKDVDDEIAEFLINPEKYDKLLPASLYNDIAELEHLQLSYTRNYIAYEFGFDLERVHNDSVYVEKYVQKLNNTFQVAIITEKFVESLILLKREMCWSFQDILFIHLRNSRYESKLKQYSLKDMQIHRDWTHVDYKIYDMFMGRHRAIVKQAGDSFQRELSTFIEILSQVTNFCMYEIRPLVHSHTYEEILKRCITISKTTFNQEFKVEAADCVLMSLDEDIMWMANRVQKYPELCEQDFVRFVKDNVEKGISGINKSNIFCGSNMLKYNVPKRFIRESFWKT